MSDEEPTDREKTLIAMQACVTHANDLVAAAKAVMTSGQPHIAYHLATLALDELGRRELIALRIVAQKTAVPPAWPEKHTQDHVKKLFWCFFGGGFLANQLNKEGFDEATNLAERVHLNRIAGLYVDAADDGIGIPSEAIAADHAEALLKLAEVRLKMAKLSWRQVRCYPCRWSQSWTTYCGLDAHTRVASRGGCYSRYARRRLGLSRRGTHSCSRPRGGCLPKRKLMWVAFDGENHRAYE